MKGCIACNEMSDRSNANIAPQTPPNDPPPSADKTSCMFYKRACSAALISGVGADPPLEGAEDVF